MFGVFSWSTKSSQVIWPIAPPSAITKSSRTLFIMKLSLSFLALRSEVSTNTPVTTFSSARTPNVMYRGKT
eukprot:1972082-Heterocapsa_arctica.AAC.1